MREFDRLASEQCGVPSIVLMENAGRGAAEIAMAELDQSAVPPPSGPRVVVVCGAGNNGGDGYVVARRLLVRGVRAEVIALVPAERLKGDALANYRAFVGVGGRVHAVDGAVSELGFQLLDTAELVVDAVLGTGLDRPVEGTFADAIERINAAPGRRLALDIPSGLDADTGQVHGVAVRADVTVTFAAHKLGLLTPSGLAHTGRVEVVDIGVPLAALNQLGENALVVEASDVRQALPSRAKNAHKGTSGRVLILAGSPGKVGAALLVAHGALRAGAGLVTLAGRPEVADTLDQRVLEAMTARYELERLDETLGALLEDADAVVIGPGLGLDDDARKVVNAVVLEHGGPVVVDADAITHFQGRPSALSRARGRRILTPHPGELGRLLGTSARDVEADRLAALEQTVKISNATVLLKGPHTLVGAPGLPPFVGRAGSSALATGGAGDVLSGVIGALAATLEAPTAAFTGAFLHARAGELWAREHGADRGLLAHEIADFLPRALAEVAALDRRSTD